MALVQLSGDFNLHLRLFYTASHEIHRFVNIYDVGQSYPILMFGTQRPAGLVRYRLKVNYLAGQKTTAHLVPKTRTEKSIDAAHKCVVTQFLFTSK